MPKPILVPIVALSTSLVICFTALAASKSTRDGVFTAEQAERGKAVYEKSCKNCHQPDFYAEKLLRYENKPLSGLFETVSSTMPADNVGSLPTSEYVDVLAYVFSITGSPAGKTELSADAMEDINIAKPQ